MNAPVPIQVVVIGAGDMGGRHARHWAAAGARVLAVVDPDRSRAELVAADTEAQAFSEAAAALALGPDVVSVCTPTHLHPRYTVASLEIGAHVLCEKPVALTLADGYAMRDAAATHGRELRIGFMRRFDAAYDQLMDFTFRAGRPLLAQATITAGVRPKRLMHDALANGGPIIDMCCHLFSLWDHMMGGQPHEASALGYTFSDGKAEVAHIRHRALDSALITLRYRDGSIGQIQVSWGLPSGIEPLERHTYVGPDGLVTVDWPTLITLRDGRGVTCWRNSGGDPWKAEIVQFHDELVRAAERRVATVDEGIEALKTSLAVLRSVALGRPVPLAEVAAEDPDPRFERADGGVQ